MTEFFEMDPQDLREDVVEEFSARSDEISFKPEYGILSFLFFFGFLADASNPNGKGQSFGASSALAISLVALLGLAYFFIVPLLCKYGILPNIERGSRIVVSERKLYWWHGPVPKVERCIDIDDIGSVVFLKADEESEGDGKMVLMNQIGEPIEFPQSCVAHPRRWAWVLTKHFPSIRYDWTDDYPGTRLKSPAG